MAYVKISMTVLNNLEYDKYISVDRTDSNCSYDGKSIKKELVVLVGDRSR